MTSVCFLFITSPFNLYHFSLLKKLLLFTIDSKRDINKYLIFISEIIKIMNKRLSKIMD